MNFEEIIENVLAGNQDESMVNQPFMVEAFGEDINFDVDFDSSVDTDMDRKPFRKKQILIEIETLDQDIIKDVEEGGKITEEIKSWAKQYGLDVYYDGIYTNDDGITIVFDIPADDHKWEYGESIIKKENIDEVNDDDDLDTIAEKEYKKFISGKIKVVEKPKASYYEFLEIFKLGYERKGKKTKTEKKPTPEPVNPEVEEYRAVLDKELTEKYNVKLSDIDISDEKISDNIKNNKSVIDFISEISSKYDLIPVTPQNSKSGKVSDEDSETSQYICNLLDSQGNRLGQYNVSSKDDKYVSMFLEVIGVKMKTGDRIEFEE
jgi:hypothetical protein